jgi:lysophospholipase L1-like esterase
MRRVLLGVCLALVLVEMCLGLLERLAPELYSEAAPTPTVYPETAETAGLPSLKVSIHELRQPNRRARMGSGALYRTNSLGIRGPEYGPSPDPGAFRIVIAGDSFTMGAGVSEKDAYPGILEELLNRGTSERRYEVVNLGIAGLSARAIVRRMNRLLPRLGPKLLVYGYTLNDIEGPAYLRVEPADRARWKNYRNRLAGMPSRVLRLFGGSLLCLQQAIAPHPGSYVFEARRNYFENPAAWKALEKEIERMKTLADERHICMVLFIHANLEQLRALHPYKGIYSKLSDAATQRGIFVVSSFERLSGHRARSLWLAPHNVHPNPAAHALYADALERGVRALPSKCLDEQSP